MRTRPRLLPSILLATCAAAAQGTGGAESLPGRGYLIDPDGGVRYFQTGDGAGLEAVAVGSTVNDLAVLEGGARLLVLPAQPIPGARRGSKTGILSIAGIQGAMLHAGARRDIPIGGVGMRAVVDRDGRIAYVLTSSGPAAGAPPPDIAIEAVDLESGRTIAATRLEFLPPGMALHPEEHRLFFAAPDRVDTYTVRPLAASWRYRSPGANRALTFRPGTSTLFVARALEIAVFDPTAIAGRDRDSSRDRSDDATDIIPLPFEPTGLLASPDGRLVAAWGGSRISLIDAARLEPLREMTIPDAIRQATSVRPVLFGPEGLLVACFPGGALVPVRFTAPPPPSPSPAPSVAPSPAPSGSPSPAPSASPPPAPPMPAPPASPAAPGAGTPPGASAIPAAAGVVPDASAPAPSPPPSPEARPAAPGSAAITPEAGTAPAAPEAGLSGHLTGKTDLVEAIVLYGPASIVRERARATPSGGDWTMALPPPGVYRIVPLGRGSQPLRARPNFRTVTVGAEGLALLDFEIVGLP